MAPTFYGVLGVGPDADAEAIAAGYRERVTEVHPDVNDDPDADAQFKRLTTAKETLLDADERARYDRLGHASYVRHHVSCSAWESVVSGTDRVGSGPESDSGGSNPDQPGRTRERRRTRSWGRGRHPTGSAPGENPGDNGAGSGGRDVAAGSAGRDARRTRGSGDGQGATRRDRSGRASADGAGETSYATSSFWDSQRVGRRYGTNTASRGSVLLRVLGAVRALGPWVFVHAVFLAAAVGTSWYVYVVLLEASTVSPLLLVVLVGEIALAVTLSTIHVVTRVYR
jgi:curved DNA-binding protein CbpA